MPEFLAGARIYCVYDTPGGDAVQDTVGDKMRRFLTSAGANVGNVEGPCHSQLAHVSGIDLIERTESSFRPVAVVRDPVFLILAGILERIVVNAFVALPDCSPGDAQDQQGNQN